ncbi:DUF4252 domain-containing protein [Chitinophaga agrisoli]|uniref:DUF4252 domain-containing protein n=1 Tax=Chitinophaga agrisoli TaxID=2607653 RepID=A0A5B2VW46_9BACT|nr:DUF4252 domain-containing protein [Chitinophaga agrisoli]KAA2242467.1 DUF4252 domain-containing protein [Chitinophaga agrisoli]
MKQLTALLICLAFLAGPATAQEKYLKKFQRQCGDSAETLRAGLGFLIKIGGALIPARLIGDEQDEAVVAKRLMQKISRLKVYYIDGPVNSESLHQLRRNLIEKEHMEELMTVRDEGSTIYMLNKGKDDELGNVVMLLKDEEELVMVHLHTSLLMSDVQNLIDHFAKND